MSGATRGRWAGMVLAAALAGCGGKDKAADKPADKAPESAATAQPAAAPTAEASQGQAFAELFHGVKLVRLPATEGDDSYQVVLPPQTNDDPIPNGPVEVRITSGEQEIHKGVPRPLYRCPKSIRSMRFKIPATAQGVKVALFKASPDAMPPMPAVKAGADPKAAGGKAGAGKAGADKPKAQPMTPEQAGIDMKNEGAAKGVEVGAAIPGLSTELTADALKGLKVPAQGERLVKESCG